VASLDWHRAQKPARLMSCTKAKNQKNPVQAYYANTTSVSCNFIFKQAIEFFNCLALKFFHSLERSLNLSLRFLFILVMS